MTYSLHFDGQLVEQFDTKAEADSYLEDAMRGWAKMSEAERAAALDWQDNSLSVIRARYLIT